MGEGLPCFAFPGDAQILLSASLILSCPQENSRAPRTGGGRRNLGWVAQLLCLSFPEAPESLKVRMLCLRLAFEVLCFLLPTLSLSLLSPLVIQGPFSAPCLLGQAAPLTWNATVSLSIYRSSCLRASALTLYREHSSQVSQISGRIFVTIAILL